MVRMILNQDTYSQKVRSVNILVSIDLLKVITLGALNLILLESVLLLLVRPTLSIESIIVLALRNMIVGIINLTEELMSLQAKLLC